MLVDIVFFNRQALSCKQGSRGLGPILRFRNRSYLEQG
jgi:hypothetical protein